MNAVLRKGYAYMNSMLTRENLPNVPAVTLEPDDEPKPNA